MKYSIAFIISLICVVNSFGQKITTDNSLPLEQLIQESLGLSCVEISNISSSVNGSINGFSSFGYFERGSSNFPFDDGIVLSTGNVNSAGNSQINAVLNDGDTSWATDSDLESALGITGTLNATSIEFDFISIANRIEFDYILASEEYFGNFPCEYSDGFAFLIREAGTNDPYTNIALVPGTSTPVNTTTVHDEIFGFCGASNEEYFQGYNVGDTNYNGRTTVLTAEATIQPNVKYQIKLVIADQTDENYDSAVFVKGNSFSASVDLGEDIATCASNYILDGNIDNSEALYSWYFNGTLIPGATNALFNVVQSGNYHVEINFPFSIGSCVIEDDVNIQLSSTQPSEPISDFELCDDISDDGIEVFDLSLKDDDVLASVPPSNYAISYHYTDNDAQNGNDEIISAIQNTVNPQVIHVRIEDITNGCLAFSTINLIVNSLPVIADPDPLVVCDDQAADGFTAIDLSLIDDEIRNGDPNLIITYHSNSTDASSASNALTIPYVNTGPNEILFVSAMNPQTGCNSTTTLDITVLDNPIIDRSYLYIDACAGDSEFVDFDLTSVIPQILQGLTNVTVSFHRFGNEAIAGTNPFPDPTSYRNITANQQTIFIRVEDDITGCATVSRLEIHTNLLLTATNISDVEACDENSDNKEEYVFEDIAIDIINGLPNVTIIFYETEDDRDNQTNAIDTTIGYENLSNPQTVYLTLSNATCSTEAEIELIVNPVIEFQPIANQFVCDDNQDGLTVTDLSQFDALVTDDEIGFSVTYFLSEQDAKTNTDPLPTLYTNTSNPFTVYPLITFDSTGCASINSFEISVIGAPVTSKPSDIIICDADRDGFFNINLINSISEVVSSTVNRTLTFHNSLEDANLDDNAILSISNYEAQTEIIFIRVENDATGCHSTEELNIIVNTLPYVGDLSNYVNEYIFCEDESDGTGEFIFETKDSEALDGQTDKKVTYYLNETDAINAVSTIDKTSIYENISNPQDIFVRIENLTDASCYTTSSFTIEVGTNPLFNEPVPWFVCDDISNDGSEIFDLSTKVIEVSSGLPDIQNVTFYASESDARNSTNPLPLEYTNTVNPQEIFVQIDDGTFCNSITSFLLNVIPVPGLLVPEPMAQCDEDYDGILNFDLTQTEINIIDIRQEDLEISYFENFEDLELNINPIPDPENFTNTSNPQTVYIKVTNIVSDCFVTQPIQLIVNQAPVINDFLIYETCPNDTNSVDLTEINEVAVDVNFNVLFSYFANEADAMANENALDTDYTYQTNFDTLFVRAEFSTTQCFNYYEFNININPLPIVNQPNDLRACDDDFDGLLDFDLSLQNSSILNGQNPVLFTITYHNSELDAQDNNTPLDIDYTAFDSEVIYARLENNSTGCYRVTQFSIRIDPLPIIDIEDQVVCIDNLPLVVSANTNSATDQYLWSTNEITPEIEIREMGTYFVTVTSELGCATTSTFNVIESEAATIEFIEAIGFSDPNTIAVTVSGIGDYAYILDNGAPQDSNIFEDVGLGFHIVTVIDLNGCGEVTQEVMVADVPKFFTPNSDSKNDTWHIAGVESLPGTIIHVFDRYGKILIKLDHNSPGWDGTYNGSDMPTDDYWYIANVIKNGVSFDVKGHFTLKR